MFKVSISGEIDEDEEYIKEILELGSKMTRISIADVDNPLTAAELLLDASNPRLVSVSVEKVTGK